MAHTRIAAVRTFVVGSPPPHRGGRTWVFVRLVTDEGVVGYGEAYAVPFDARQVARRIENVGERLVVGADPFQIELLWRTLYSAYEAQHPDLRTLVIISSTR